MREKWSSSLFTFSVIYLNTFGSSGSECLLFGVHIKCSGTQNTRSPSENSVQEKAFSNSLILTHQQRTVVLLIQIHKMDQCSSL